MSLLTRYRTPSGPAPVLGEGHDLTRDGMFIESQRPEPLGTLLEIEWEARTGRTVRALARVAWVRVETRAGKPAGMGVEFVKTGPDGRPAVESVFSAGDSWRPGGASSRPPEPSQPPSEPPEPVVGPAPVVSRAASELRDRLARVRRSAAPPASGPGPEPEPSQVAAESEEPEEASQVATEGEPSQVATEVAAEPSEAAAEEEPSQVAAEEAAAEEEPSQVAAEVAGEAERSEAAESQLDPEPEAASVAAETEPAEVAEEPSQAAAEVEGAADSDQPAEPLGEPSQLDEPEPEPERSSEPPKVEPEVEPGASRVAGGEDAALDDDPPIAASSAADQVGALEPHPAPEPGPTESIADTVVARVVDVAQSMYHDTLRPFTLKGDVPTATFRWAPWVRGTLWLAAVAGLVVLAWLRGLQLLESVLPPELLPSPPVVNAPLADRGLTTPTAAPVPAMPAPNMPAAPAERPPAPVAPPADGVEYVLDVRTVPPRARATAGGETIITPGMLSLGALAQPIELHIDKEAYQPEVATIDRTGFSAVNGRMQRELSLDLRPVLAGAAPPAAPAPEVAPTPAPPPAPSVPSAPKAVPARATARESTATPAHARAADANARKRGEAKEEKPAPEPSPPPGESPMKVAQACLARGDNACAVEALTGKARTARELELLIETHRAMGNQLKAWEVMRTYIERFPDEKRAEGYRRTLGQ